jgi:hypothetical protein
MPMMGGAFHHFGGFFHIVCAVNDLCRSDDNCIYYSRRKIMDVSKSMRETEAAFKNRAILYYYIFDEAKKAVGKEQAIDIFKKGIYRRGIDIGRNFKEFADKGDFKGLAAAFIKGVPCEGTLFTPKIQEANENGCTITFSGCPLADAWKDMGLSDEERDLICDVASAMDFGTFESAGLDLKFDGRLAAGDETCTLVISKKKG